MKVLQCQNPKRFGIYTHPKRGLPILFQIPKFQNLPSIDRGINAHMNTDVESAMADAIAKLQTH